MSDEHTKTEAPDTSTDEEIETGPAPTPFAPPFFLPAVCLGLTLWFAYDTFIHPMEEHLDFNYYGFKVVLAAAAWYSYLAYCEVKQRTVLPFVLPAIFAALAVWLGAEAFGLVELPELIEYPDISRGGFYLALALVPITAVREWMRARRGPGPTDGPAAAA
jgi:hypothetical protein